MVRRTVLLRRLQPQNQDGEGAGVSCIDAATLRANIVAGHFKLEVALVHAHALGFDETRRPRSGARRFG